MMDYDLRKEKDVREYLDNLGVEYRFGCFSEKNPDACQRLGEYLEAIQKDYTKALKVFKNNCDEYNSGKSCYKYAVLGLKGKASSSREVVNSIPAYFNKSCDAGYGDGCSVGGMMLLANGVEQETKKHRKWQTYNDKYKDSPMSDPAFTKTIRDSIMNGIDPDQESESLKKKLLPGRLQGLELLKKGCDMDNSHACYYMSAVYIQGKPNIDLPRNYVKAFIYSKKACRLGMPQACSNMSTMYRRGDGVGKNMAKSNLYRAMAKDLAGQGDDDTIDFQRGTE